MHLPTRCGKAHVWECRCSSDSPFHWRGKESIFVTFLKHHGRNSPETLGWENSRTEQDGSTTRHKHGRKSNFNARDDV
jgi:hypothetical protein